MAGTFTNLLYHLVFSTKQRTPLITERLQPGIYSYIGGIIRSEGGIPLEIGGMLDHVHILARIPPTKPISEVLNRVKAKSSKWLNAEKVKLSKFGWQDGYSAFSVSESQVSSVRRYIRDQKRHHGRRSFQDELRALLKKHAIDFDERYLLG
jgi:putative transposase